MNNYQRFSLQFGPYHAWRLYGGPISVAERRKLSEANGHGERSDRKQVANGRSTKTISAELARRVRLPL